MYWDIKDISLGELFSRLSAEAKRIVRTDLALMRAEIRARIAWLKVDMILMLAGVFCMVVGLLTLTAALVIVIASVLPAWLSALIVGLFLSAAGGSVALIGIRRLGKTQWAPKQTMEMLKEEGIWLREKLA